MQKILLFLCFSFGLLFFTVTQTKTQQKMTQKAYTLQLVSRCVWPRKQASAPVFVPWLQWGRSCGAFLGQAVNSGGGGAFCYVKRNVGCPRTKRASTCCGRRSSKHFLLCQFCVGTFCCVESVVRKSSVVFAQERRNEDFLPIL